MSWFVYILRCADNTLYTGITNDVSKRVRQHNGQTSGGAKYTRARRPVVLVWSQKMNNRSGAARLEFTIKQMSKERKEEFLRGP